MLRDAPSRQAAATAGRSAIIALPIFAAAIFLGAFLLFLVQPLIGRYILPWFGGTPGVWATCLMFFQVLLLAGYAYAHFSIRCLSSRIQVIVHIALLAAAIVVLPIAPSDRWKPAAGADPNLAILALLAANLGLPYFVLSATGPLLQAWLANRNGGKAPYRLYALSNLGCLLALGAYPFFIEPTLSRRHQAVAWSWGMAGFAWVCAACALLTWRNRPHAAAMKADDTADDGSVPPGRFTWAMWVALPAFASIMLLATNNVICREIAVVPFLWVLPLGLYLLSFIICFDSPRWYWRSIFIPPLVAAGGGLIWVLDAEPRTISIANQIAVYCAVMFVACMICHGELVRIKPPARSLTSFYLAIAAGGALGGVFVAMVAPMLFKGYLELRVGMVGVFAMLLIALASDRSVLLPENYARPIWLALLGVAFTLAIVLFSREGATIKEETVIHRERGFYSVLSINENASCRLLYHGGVVHGVQWLDPARRGEPTTYYGAPSGLKRGVDRLPAGPRRIGAVGLGIGTLASYGRPGDAIRFYEIDPKVEAIARKHFTFLRDCQADVSVALGDARLTLESERPQNLDLLVLDAFSGDAIPIHLLTREAFEIYLRHLNPDGIIAVHITNRHLNLLSPVAALAGQFDLDWSLFMSAGADWETTLQYPCDWVLLSRRKLDRTGAVPGPADFYSPIEPWTDDRASLLPILRNVTAGQ